MFWPPSKIGIEICGANDHAAEPGLNKLPSEGDKVPKLPVSEIFGKNAARAAPIFAFAASNDCSAAAISGRRASRSEGKPAGISVRRFWLSSDKPGGKSA